MLITIGLFWEFRPNLPIFSSDAILKIVKKQKQLFWYIIIFTNGVFTFWAGQRDGRISYFIKQLPEKSYGVCVNVNKIIMTNGRHLGLECYGFYNSRIATYTQEKNYNLHIIFLYFFIFPKGQHSYTQDSFRHGTVCGGRLAPLALSSSCL